MMKRTLWGELADDSESNGKIKTDQIILPSKKAENLKKLKTFMNLAEAKIETLTIESPIITQTIEVMNQTEMLQTLIDTYASKSGLTSYLLNPRQLIPQVDFPAENACDLVNEERFCKPFWFLPPIETDFTRGEPVAQMKLNRETAKRALRKSLCGLLRAVGFSDAANNALTLFTDSIEEYIINLLAHTKDIKTLESNDCDGSLDVITLEKGYQILSHSSLTSLHNYFKTSIIARNKSEINEFKDIYQDYDKLMKESQSLQKITFRDDDYMNFFDFSNTIQTNSQHSEVGRISIMNLLESTDQQKSTGGYKYIFEGEIMEPPRSNEHIMNNFGVGPPSMEG